MLRDDGIFVVVEPRLTPFLRFAHAMCRIKPIRRLWPKLDALAIMIEHEQRLYDQWLGAPEEITSLIEIFFQPQRRSIKWGKLSFVGRKRQPGNRREPGSGN